MSPDGKVCFARVEGGLRWQLVVGQGCAVSLPPRLIPPASLCSPCFRVSSFRFATEVVGSMCKTLVGYPQRSDGFG